MTIIQALIAYVLVKRAASMKAFSILYVATFMRCTESACLILTTKTGLNLDFALSNSPCGYWLQQV